jgi:hypothetical protein
LNDKSYNVYKATGNVGDLYVFTDRYDGSLEAVVVYPSGDYFYDFGSVSYYGLTIGLILPKQVT